MRASNLATLLALCTAIGLAKEVTLPENWHTRSSPVASQLNDIAYGNGLFVAAGLQNTLLTSSNGVIWSPQTSATSTGELFSVTFGNGWFVAGGREPAMIQSSTDGVHWTNRLFTLGGEEVYGITYGEGLFVAVGRRAGLGLSYVATSMDTIGWLNRQGLPTTNTLLDVAHGNGEFVAVGERGTIITSSDTTTWALRSSGTEVSLRAVVFHAGRFIAGGDANTVLSSSDGVTWTPAAPPSFAVRGLASNGEIVVAVGNTIGIGKLHASSDGLTWPGQAEEFPDPLNGISFGAETFVAVGDEGLIVQSQADTQGATNEWIKPTSGNWEEPYWSLGERPSIRQGAIQFSNPGFKALAIAPSTTTDFPETLSISNLFVYGTGNLLLLNYAGLEVPLQVHSDFVLGPGTALLSYYSALQVSNFYVSGTATFAQSSIANFGTLQAGMLAPGQVNISNAVLTSERLLVGSGSGMAGRVSQYGGTNVVTGMAPLAVNQNSSYYLGGGTLLVPSANFIGGGPTNQLIIAGGQMDVAGTIMLLRADGQMQGGALKSGDMRVVEGPFTQAAGLNDAGTLAVADAQFGNAEYILAGGTLLTTNVMLGSGFGVVGTFHHRDGVHSNTALITMWGLLRTMQNHVQGRYNLSLGLLAADTLVIYGGDFNQSGGTNLVRELLFDQYGTVHLTGGSLHSSNTVVSAEHGSLPLQRSIFFHSNGTHAVENRLITENWGAYHLLGGSLLTKVVDVRDAFAQSGGLHANSQTVTVHGSYSLNDGLLSSPFLFVDGTGTFTQNGGTNRADRLYMDIRGFFNLGGGTLSTSNSTVSSANAANRDTRPLFLQTNGVHHVQSQLTVDAVYRLRSGTLVVSNVVISPDGDFWLEGGNVTNSGRFTMYDGSVFARGQHHNLGQLYLRLGLLARFEQRMVATLDLQNDGAVVRFADSREASSEWNGRLAITNWNGSISGGGADQVFFGATAQGLTPAQLERVAFVNPAGFPAGNYPATILATGEVVPMARPAMSFMSSSNRLVISWAGNYQLLTATNVAGPFEVLVGVLSPYTNSFTDPQRFFRLRSQP